MLEIKDINFSFNNVSIFENLSIKIQNGEFLYLLGKSGSGKTTLFNLISMKYFPDAGTIQFMNFSSDKIKSKEISELRKKIGIVFQDYKLLKDRNIFENLNFVLESVNVPKKERSKRIDFVLNEVGLLHKKHSKLEVLSGGEKQRIAIARALLNNPILILADEPTGNLDPETSLEILKILKKINQKGTALIIATHNMELLKLQKGKVVRIKNMNIEEEVLEKEMTPL